MENRLTIEFSKFLTSKGYSKGTINHYCRYVENLNIDKRITKPDDIYETINISLEKAQDKLSGSKFKTCRAGYYQYFLMLTGVEFKKYEDQKNIILDDNYDLISSFYIFLTEIKNVNSSTAQSQCYCVRLFLNYHKINKLNQLISITIDNIRQFIKDTLKDVKPRTVSKYISSIRNLFRYATFEGININSSMIDIQISPAIWKQQSLPIILTEEEQTLITNYNFIANKNGRRDKLIVFLMLDLGLRCTEVSSLQLTDIRWFEGVINIKHTKNKISRQIPFSSYIGELLENYIIQEREKHSPTQALFLKNGYLNVGSPMNPENVRYVIRTLFNKIGIHGPAKGTHVLRRTAASRIFNAGNGLKTTADLLGHRSLESSTHYVRHDFESLRNVCSEWPKNGAN